MSEPEHSPTPTSAAPTGAADDSRTVGYEPAAVPSGDSGPAEAGRYRVLGEIARGGMGAVLLGRDPEIGRELAIKVLLEQHHDRPELERRFVEEARIAGRLQHPGIVPVYDVGRFADRRPYIAMKLVEGRTLADLLGERAAPSQDLPRFLAVFEHVCLALAYAHARGVIHRDLKPHNVMVGAFGEVQVMDWGLAKVLRAAEAAAGPAGASEGPVDVSQAGSVLGTPAYMAPEQARGETDRLDERCDVFGLGAILCVVLTGQPPFAGADALARAQKGDLAEARARLEGSGADGELRALAADCLAADPAGRPRDAGEVARRVTAYLAGVQERLRGAEVERAAAEARAAAERRARRLSLGLAGTLLALLLLGGAGGLWVLKVRADRRADQERRDQQTTAQVTALLDRAAELRRQARYADARVSIEEAARQLPGGVDPAALEDRLKQVRQDLDMAARLEVIRVQELEAAVDPHDNLAGIERLERQYRQAFQEYGLDLDALPAEEIARRVQTSDLRAQLVEVLDNWARSVRSRSRPEFDRLTDLLLRADPDGWRVRLRKAGASNGLGELRRMADESRGADLPPQNLVMLSHLLRLAGDPGRAVEVLQAAQRRHPGDLGVNYQLGYQLFQHQPRRPGEALPYLRAALAIRPDSIVVQMGLMADLAFLGQGDEAIELCEKILRVHPDLLRVQNALGQLLCEHRKDYSAAARVLEDILRSAPDDVAANHHLGVVRFHQDRLEEAEGLLRKVLRQQPSRGLAHYNLGNILERRGRTEEAVAEYRDALRYEPDLALAVAALESLGKLSAEDRAIEAARAEIRTGPGRAAAYVKLGSLLHDGRKDYRGAEAAFREAVRINPRDAEAHRLLAIALWRQVRLAEAEDAAREAVRQKPDYAEAHCTLGDCLLKSGKFAAAAAAFRRGDELGSKQPGWPYPSAQFVRYAEHLAELERRLPAVLGGAPPAGPAEQVEFASLCLNHKRLHAAAARYYEGAFAADPKLLPVHRHDAARAAVLAAAGQGNDTGRLSEAERARLRTRAREWLQGDLNAWAATANRLTPADRAAVRGALQGWQRDPTLAPVRDSAGLAGLPDAERAAWRKLWDGVEELVRRLADSSR